MLTLDVVLAVLFAVGLVAAGALFGAWVTWTTGRLRSDAHFEVLQYARSLALGELMASDKKMPTWVAEHRRLAALQLAGEKVTSDNEHEAGKQGRKRRPHGDVPGPAELEYLHSANGAAD